LPRAAAGLGVPCARDPAAVLRPDGRGPLASHAGQRIPIRSGAPSPVAVSDGARTLRAELARKALHLATASLPIAWAFGAVDTRDLRIVLGVATGVALAIEAARLAAPRVERAFVAVVGRLLRAHENGHLTGATWLAIAMAAVVWLAPQRAALVALWAAAVGDA